MKVYACAIVTPSDEESNEIFLRIAEDIEKMKDSTSKKFFSKYIFELFNYMRDNMNLPNKMLSISRNKDKNKARIVLFDREPDGKYYNVLKENKDGKVALYIEI